MGPLLLALAVAAPLSARAGDVPARAPADDPPDARMLLDLDLLGDAELRDPSTLGRIPVVQRMRLLEMLRVLETPAAAHVAPRPVQLPPTRSDTP